VTMSHDDDQKLQFKNVSLVYIKAIILYLVWQQDINELMKLNNSCQQEFNIAAPIASLLPELEL